MNMGTTTKKSGTARKPKPAKKAVVVWRQGDLSQAHAVAKVDGVYVGISYSDGGGWHARAANERHDRPPRLVKGVLLIALMSGKHKDQEAAKAAALDLAKLVRKWGRK